MDNSLGVGGATGDSSGSAVKAQLAHFLQYGIHEGRVAFADGHF